MMSGTFRKTDLFALIGLLSLLLWTPSYLGADETVRPLADGETFTLPAPREGDRIVYEMVVRAAGEDPQVVGPIGASERRLVMPTEGPEDAVWVETWRYEAGTWDLSIGELRTWSSDRAIYYGADGLPVWYAYDGHGRHEGLFPALRGSGLNDDQGAYHYTSDFAFGSVADLARRALENDGERVLTSALEHRGKVLLGGSGTTGRIYDRFIDIGESHLAVHPDHKMVVLPWEFHNRGNLVFHTAPDHFAVEEWKWYHTDAAAAVGYHFGYANRGQQSFLEIDILPRIIERGEGPELPAARQGTPWNSGNAMPRPAHPSADAIMMPLRDLDQDPRPIMSGVSLPILRTLLEDRSGWEGAFAGDAQIVGFSAEQAPIGTNWTLLLLDADDRVTLGHLQIGVEIDLLVEGILCSDLASLGTEPCSTTAGVNEPFRCHSLHTMWNMCPDPNPDPLDLDRQVADPWALWTTAEAPADGWTSVTMTPEPDVAHIGWRMPENWFGRALQTLSPERGEVHPHLGYTQVAGQDKVPLMRWNLMDGRLDRHTTAPDPEPRTPLIAEAPDGAIANPIGFVPVSVAAGGFGLVLLSVLARSWATLRMLMLAGLAAFYARVQDEDVLDHTRRDEIMQVLRAEPGLTATEIAARMKLAWGVTAHHLERLRKAGVVHTRRDGRRRHHFPMELVHPERILATRNAQYERFLEAVAAAPGISLRDIERQVGRTRSAVSRTGSRLVRLGLLEKRRDGMVVRFYPRPSSDEDGP